MFNEKKQGKEIINISIQYFHIIFYGALSERQKKSATM